MSGTREADLAQVLHDALSHYQGHVNPQTETHRVQHEYDARAVIAALEANGWALAPSTSPDHESLLSQIEEAAVLGAVTHNEAEFATILTLVRAALAQQEGTKPMTFDADGTPAEGTLIEETTDA